jgi:hypothetical protein
MTRENGTWTTSPKLNLEAELAKLDAVRDLSSADAAPEVAKALTNRNNLIVSKAAKLALHYHLTSLVSNLATAFPRFLENSTESDPGCWAKNALARTCKAMLSLAPSPAVDGVIAVGFAGIGYHAAMEQALAKAMLAAFDCNTSITWELAEGHSFACFVVNDTQVEMEFLYDTTPAKCCRTDARMIRVLGWLTVKPSSPTIAATRVEKRVMFWAKAAPPENARSSA